MARKKPRVADEPRTDLFEIWQSMQLSEEEKAEARARTEERAAEVPADEVWALFLAIEGTVPGAWDFYKKMREEED